MADEIRQKLGFDVGEALKNLALLRASLGQTSSSLTTLAKNGSALNGQFGQNTQRSLQQATTAVTTFGSQTRAAAASTTPAVTQLTVSFETLARVVQTQFVVRAISALRDALRQSVVEFIEFEKSIAQVQTISDRSLGNFSALAATAREMAISFNTPVLEQSRALYEAISNQVIKTRNDLDLLTVANQFATATNSSVADSSQLLAGAINAYGLATKDAQRLASQFFVTLDKGAIQAAELNTAFGRIAPLARNVGVSIEDALASLATLTIGGVKPAESATQLRGILSDLVKPTESMTKAFKELGVASAEEIIQSRGLLGALQALNQTTNGSTEEIARLFDQVRGLSGELALTGRGTNAYREAFEALRNVSSDLVQKKFLLVAGQHGQTVDREFNKLAITIKQELGQSIIETTNNLLSLTGGTDKLIEAGRAAGPIIADVAVGVGSLAAGLGLARLNALRLSPALSAAGLSAGQLLSTLIVLEGGAFIGENLGKRISDFKNLEINSLKEIIQARKQAEREATQAVTDELRNRLEASKTAANQELQSVRFKYDAEVESARLASEKTREAVSQTLNTIINAQQARVTELRQTAAEAARGFDQSVDRANTLRRELEDIDFANQLEKLRDPQKFQAILGSSVKILQQTRRQLADAADPKQIELAQQRFERAAALAEQAKEFAREKGDRRAELQAAAQLVKIKQTQLRIETDIQAKLQEREKVAKRAEAQEAQRLEGLRSAADRILELSVPFDKDKLLTEEDRAKRKADLQTAVKDLFSQVKAADSTNIAQLLDVVNLGTRINEQLTQAQIQQVTLAPQAFQSIVDQFAAAEITLNVRVKNIDEEVQKVEEAIKGINTEGEIRQKILDEELDQKLFNELGKRIQNSTIHNLFSGDDVDGMRRIAAELVNLNNTGQLTRENLAGLFREFRALGADGTGGTDPQVTQLFNLALGMVNRAEQFAGIRNDTTTIKDNSAQTVLSFDALNTRAANLRTNLQLVNDELSKMQTGSGATAVARAHGGLIRYLAAGGFSGRGTDRIHAMLSRDEFVVNARSSRRFFSQLQSINAGQAPVMRNQGGVVNNVTIGDVNVQGGGTPSKTGRAIASELRRELRRGSIRGF